jgi:hypothetical protein
MIKINRVLGIKVQHYKLTLLKSTLKHLDKKLNLYQHNVFINSYLFHCKFDQFAPVFNICTSKSAAPHEFRTMQE